MLQYVLVCVLHMLHVCITYVTCVYYICYMCVLHMLHVCITYVTCVYYMCMSVYNCATPGYSISMAALSESIPSLAIIYPLMTIILSLYPRHRVHSNIQSFTHWSQNHIHQQRLPTVIKVDSRYPSGSLQNPRQASEKLSLFLTSPPVPTSPLPNSR
jgi:hypothetical protein